MAAAALQTDSPLPLVAGNGRTRHLPQPQAMPTTISHPRQQEFGMLREGQSMGKGAAQERRAGARDVGGGGAGGGVQARHRRQ